MRKIGIIASGASEIGASVILNKDEEKTVKVEDLVLIANKNGNNILAVCRRGRGSNENLKTGSYTPGIAYARKGGTPSNAKAFYDFKLSVIGDVTSTLHHRRRKIEDLESLIKQSEKLAKYDIRRDLKCPPETVLKTSRYYVRCLDSTSPFCFEAHKDKDVNELLAYFRANYNPATGLPFPLDLIHGNVSLPRGFTKEFVEEVETLLIQDSDLDKIDLTNFFMYLNPQKKE